MDKDFKTVRLSNLSEQEKKDIEGCKAHFGVSTRTKALLLAARFFAKMKPVKKGIKSEDLHEV